MLYQFKYPALKNYTSEGDFTSEKLVFYFGKKTNYKAVPLGKEKLLLKERGRQRVHSAVASVEVCLSLLQRAAEQNRTDTVCSTHLSIPRLLGEVWKEWRGREGVQRKIKRRISAAT